MSNIERAPDAAPSDRDAAEGVHIDGSRVVSADYGMPGTPGLGSPLKPLMWLLVPFFFCLAYGLMTR